MENRIRLDILLYEKGLTESREKAKSLIMSGCVFVGGKNFNKPSTKIDKNTCITVKENTTVRYVGRGAYKLEKALSLFNIDLNGFTAVDVGASTGGFTDCMLQNKAKKVYAVDVGHKQLHSKLKKDERVVPLDGINFRYANKSMFCEDIDFITADVSFISLSFILPIIVEISHKNTSSVVLIKPQFEAGKNNVGKNGIVKDKKIHLSVLNGFEQDLEKNSLYIENITYSPIKGGEGNIEYLAYIKHGKYPTNHSETFKSLIKEAFDLL